MNKPYKIHRIKARTPEWHKFRLGARVGASEVRTVMYSDDYTNRVTLYYKKLGMKNDTFDNEAMLHGRELEDHVANMWQYWDGKVDEFDIKGYINNFNNGRMIRRCRNLNGIVTNPDYPYLFGDPDKLINKKGGFKLNTGEPLNKEGVLEIKTVEGWAADKWKYDIDPAYYTQLQTYLMLLGLDYGEIAVLKNGRYLDVFSFDENKDTQSDIVNAVNVFCKDHVEPALEHAHNYRKAKAIGDQVLEEESLAAIHEYEPDPGSSDTYEQFVKEKYLGEEITIQGTEEMLIFAKRDKELAYLKGQIEKMKQANKNKILKVIDHKQCDVIDFGDNGVVKFFTKKGGKLPQIGNNIKHEFNQDGLIEAVRSKVIT